MPVKTLYSVLGVETTASDEDIQNAFIRAKVRYPQAKLQGDDAARMQFLAIEQAYATLSNEDTRAAYDQRLAAAGVQTAKREIVAESAWAGSRNYVIVGAIVLVAAAGWFYQSHQRTKAEKEIAERALKLLEDERRHRADLERLAEERRQAQFESSREDAERRREESARREFQSEAQRSAQQTTVEQRRVQQEAQSQQRQREMEQRRQQQEQLQAERQRQLAQRQMEQDAQRRLAQEQQQLRALCMQRYGRPDC
jgi:curved DNA-binding protein CbpA